MLKSPLLRNADKSILEAVQWKCTGNSENGISEGKIDMGREWKDTNDKLK